MRIKVAKGQLFSSALKRCLRYCRLLGEVGQTDRDLCAGEHRRTG